MGFEERYNILNENQRMAVDNIEGPLMVIAGPGTGKTELLSMRAAKILKETDISAQNILCLTFTEAGATAMQKRLIEHLGREGYKISVHTFHGFAADIMSRYREYFYNGAELSIIDNLTRHQILSSILDDLPYDNPLKTSVNDEYLYIGNIISAISEIKRSSLSTEELLDIFRKTISTADQVEPILNQVFLSRVSKKTLSSLESAINQLEEIHESKTHELITPYHDVLMSSLYDLISESRDSERTTPPLSAWKSNWLEKNHEGNLQLKARSRTERLLALLPIIEEYIKRTSAENLQDYDDLIISLINALENHPELRFDLHEKYLYLMIDEFQDTNLSQMRIINELTNNPVNEGKPNLMIVGDDDQAIYSFQGANVGNILTFKDKYPTAKQVVLTDNYRSPEIVIKGAEAVISQGSERLATKIGISKILKTHKNHSNAQAEVHQFKNQSDEHAFIASKVNGLIAEGVNPSEIAIIGMRHQDLEGILPYLINQDIPVSYEKRENVLEDEAIHQITLLAQIVNALADSRPDIASISLPELLSHPAWGVKPQTLWQLGLKSHQEKKLWMELISEFDETKLIFEWLIEVSAEAKHLQLELIFDKLIGNTKTDSSYTSPLKKYFFTSDGDDSFSYINHLESLIAIREAMREYYISKNQLLLNDYINFVSLAKSTKTHITRIRNLGAGDGVQVTSAHGAKGLEYEHVFIINAIDSRWGEKVGSRGNPISYPENLRFRAKANTFNDRIRLFFVAMTRAKKCLYISFAEHSTAGKPQLLASFLSDNPSLEIIDHRNLESSKTEELLQTSTLWYQPIVEASPASLKSALESRLLHYKLSPTDLNAYLDVSRGGPKEFLINNLLCFPSAMSPEAAYGSAVHATLERAHTHIKLGRKPLPVSALIEIFIEKLTSMPLSPNDLNHYLERGRDKLSAFLESHYSSFNENQTAEISFYSQQVQIDDAKLTGKLDLLSFDKKQKTIEIVDYKTGKHFTDWDKGIKRVKLKSHRFKQQLLFYDLLIQNSRDYSEYQVSKNLIQFVEPDNNGEIHSIELERNNNDLERTEALAKAVWRQIMSANFPDTSGYEPSVNGVKQFEDDLLEGKFDL